MSAGPLTAVDGIYWRAMFAADAGDPLRPARAPEGRSHHGGQRALYLSATPEGCVVTSRVYLRPGDPERVILPLWVRSGRIVDLRDAGATAAWGIDTTHRAADWQAIRATGAPSPTWAISDRVRALGLDGMLYASRSHPAKTHLTLFSWALSGGPPGGAEVAPGGAPVPFPDEEAG